MALLLVDIPTSLGNLQFKQHIAPSVFFPTKKHSILDYFEVSWYPPHFQTPIFSTSTAQDKRNSWIRGDALVGEGWLYLPQEETWAGWEGWEAWEGWEGDEYSHGPPKSDGLW